MSPRTLIIGIGNPLRSDDGIGWRAAERLRACIPSTVAHVIATHQLTPELAEAASRSICVIFIDASLFGAPGQVTCAQIEAAPQAECNSHWLTPEQILALSAELYGTEPLAFTISIGGADFSHGELLSEAVQAALPKIVTVVDELLLRLPDGFLLYSQL